MKMRSRFRTAVVTAMLAVVVSASLLVGMASPAGAATVRPGAQSFQVDILLDKYETEKAAKSFWGATVICAQIGLPGWVTIAGVCQTAVSVCAARAYTASPRKNAGMTIGRGGGFWCWRY